MHFLRHATPRFTILSIALTLSTLIKLRIPRLDETSSEK